MTKRRRALVLPLLFALLTALAVSGCSAAPHGSGKVLRIGVRSDIPDFGYQNPDSGRFYGLEIDIAEELARRMGYTPELVADTAEARASLLEDGTVDCLIVCYTVTDARRERFDFSAPYYYDNTVAVVESTTGFIGLRDLRSARVGVLAGSTAGDLFTAAMTAEGLGRLSFTLAELSSYDELSAALARQLPAIQDGPHYRGVVASGGGSTTVRFTATCAERDRSQLTRDMGRAILLMLEQELGLAAVSAPTRAPTNAEDAPVEEAARPDKTPAATAAK